MNELFEIFVEARSCRHSNASLSGAAGSQFSHMNMLEAAVSDAVEMCCFKTRRVSKIESDFSDKNVDQILRTIFGTVQYSYTVTVKLQLNICKLCKRMMFLENFNSAAYKKPDINVIMFLLLLLLLFFKPGQSHPSPNPSLKPTQQTPYY